MRSMLQHDFHDQQQSLHDEHHQYLNFTVDGYADDKNNANEIRILLPGILSTNPEDHGISCNQNISSLEHTRTNLYSSLLSVYSAARPQNSPLLVRKIEREPFPVFSRPVAPRLSSVFMDMLSGLMALESDWDGDGADPIDGETANKALRVAAAMLSVASEPFIAPAPSGEILLQWDFPDTHIEVFVDSETEFPEDAGITRGANVQEVDLGSIDDLRALLSEHQKAKDAG